MSWDEVGRADNPVRGDAAAFDDAARQWRAGSDRAVEIQQTFRQIIGDPSSIGLEGDAARALSTLASSTQQVLDDVPGVFATMADALGSHAARVRELRGAADQALGRALAAKRARDSANQKAQVCNTRAVALRRQISQLQMAPPEQSAGQITVLQSQLSGESTTLQSCQTGASEASQEVASCLRQWDDLRAQEDRLNRETAHKLDQFDLGSLRDPSWLDKELHSLGKFFTDLGEDIGKAIAAMVAGDWEQALWDLRDALDKLETIIDVISTMILVVTVAIALIAGTAVSFGVLGPALLMAALVVASLKFETTSVLLSRNSVNKETGQRLGVSDLIFDGVDVALAAVAVEEPAKIKPAGFKKYNLAKNNVARQVLKDEFGLSFKKGFSFTKGAEISWKKTAEGAARRLLTGNHLGVVTPLAQGILGNDYLRDEVRNATTDTRWAGTPAIDERYYKVSRAIANLRSYIPPALSAPVSCVVVPIGEPGA